MRWTLIAVVAAGASKACIDASERSETSGTDNMRPRGDLCSPSYAAERYAAEHESGADVRCEDEQ